MRVEVTSHDDDFGRILKTYYLISIKSCIYNSSVRRISKAVNSELNEPDPGDELYKRGAMRKPF